MFSDFKSKIHLKTDWADLDLFCHVNNVAFFRYMQSARVGYCDQIGLSSLNETPQSFMVASAQCQFLKPLKFPDDIIVYSKVNWIKNSSFELVHQIVNQNGELCAEGTDILVVYDHSKKTKSRVSEELIKVMEKLQQASIIRKQ